VCSRKTTTASSWAAAWASAISAISSSCSSGLGWGRRMAPFSLLGEICWILNVFSENEEE